jgi:hypothetical protein
MLFGRIITHKTINLQRVPPVGDREPFVGLQITNLMATQYYLLVLYVLIALSVFLLAFTLFLGYRLQKFRNETRNNIASIQKDVEAIELGIKGVRDFIKNEGEGIPEL